MGKLALEIVTIERKVWEDDGLDMIILPGADGELGILPSHTPLLTALKPGVIVIRKGGSEELFAVGGGFADVRPTKVTVLADTAEHSEEIDAERAEAARRQAEEVLAHGVEAGPSIAIMRQALMRSQIRLKVARRRHRGPGMGASREEL
ncbi:MAG: F0F1 ATP synthase subunit epsilon [Ardenticatenales bacterium]|nr:F0F1 ATP synthase subunit epsilon [Ardenticatenales bacterium]